MSGRILIADNAATNRIMLRVKLSAASYDVTPVTNAQALMEEALRSQPDLILVDADLPEMDGVEICERLKTTVQTAAIPVVVVAQDYSPELRLNALRAGAEEILPKPIQENVLLTRVCNILRAHGVEQELQRREGTAAEFGFNDASADFIGPANVVLVRDHQTRDTAWETALRKEMRAAVTVSDDTTVLADVGHAVCEPDVIVLHPALSHTKNCLTLVAELRSRSETRHSAIIVTGSGADRDMAIAALDLGANDLLEDDALLAEIIHRTTTQAARKRKSDRLRATLENGLKLAATDPLTGLFNRRYALPHTARIAAQSSETGSPFAVMVLDLDRFKRINDTYGHAAGDAVLCEVARRLKNNLRSVDMICRMGGEEFLVVMPATGLPAAQNAAERLRRVTEATPVTLAETGQHVPVTLSIGVSIGGLAGQPQIPVERIVDTADRALMGSKLHGRNQVTFEQTAA